MTFVFCVRRMFASFFFFFNDTATTEIYTLSLHDALPISFPPGDAVPPCRIISLGHALTYLQSYVRRHWNVLRHLQFKDPAFGFLMTLEKARRGGAGRRGEEGVEVVPPSGERRPRRRG